MPCCTVFGMHRRFPVAIPYDDDTTFETTLKEVGLWEVAEVSWRFSKYIYMYIYIFLCTINVCIHHSKVNKLY
jgi:hypothetical protein